MKNTVSQPPKTVSKKAENSAVQAVRVSDMGMRRKISTETEKQQSVIAAV
ncbi:MAG TPA: hypothetical protein VK796_04465 [Cytophaga sp.]|nr:hypothetical protein [Cytophaga sp.]